MKHFQPEELEFKNDTFIEKRRTRKFFEELKKRAIEGKFLLEREKRFLCIGLKISKIIDDGKPENFRFCDDFIFRELFLTYFYNNLSGPFNKHKNGKMVEVSKNEQINDFKQLQIFSNKWQKEIEITNHKDQVLQELAIETRKDLKELDVKYPKIIRNSRKQESKYLLQKAKIIMYSKFIYLLIKSVRQDYPQSEFEIPFSGQTIEFTIYSFIHIISRHYSADIKDKPDKTYHYDYFHPKELHIDLRKILTEIDKINLIDINETDNIVFEYKGVIYHLWLQKKIKQVKGKENVNFNRVQSFYPIYNENKIIQIQSEYNKVELGEKLKVFVKIANSLNK
jgi:hypothetical protein